jgi:phenylalanyl-tRNA synthetase alpha chain
MSEISNQTISTCAQHIKKSFFEVLVSAQTEDALEALRIEVLGRQGKLTELLKHLKDCTVEEKREFGPLLNGLKHECEIALSNRKKELIECEQALINERKKNFDVTAYEPYQLHGSLHPYTHITRCIEDVFISMGCEIVDGPELETEYYNFEALNIPANHPARDIQDTFWLTMPGQLMRTHTSPVQIRSLESKQLPLALIASGRTYRHEATDASHDYVFMQTEGMWIGEGISVSNLVAIVKKFLAAIFEREDIVVRMRPGYFPFVEPGIEFDMQCPFCSDGCSVCKKTRWIEIMGSGLVHPNVLRCTGVDTERYTGFAFGFGLTRMAMLKYRISDIRLLCSNRQAFLEQF